jgi:hypothetical protein
MKYLCIIRAHQRNWVQALGGNTCAFELPGQVEGARAEGQRAPGVPPYALAASL